MGEPSTAKTLARRWLQRGSNCAVYVLVASAPIPAAADDPAPPAIVRDVAPVVVRDLRPEDLPDDPTAFTTVIDVDRYEGEAKTVEDVLSEVPGVRVRRFGGAGQPSEVTIRGSTASQVVVLLDGIRLDSAQSGVVDLSSLSLDLLERIEVSRGGGSVQQGSGAIGGVVNLVTRRPGARPRTVVTGELASFGTGEGSLLHAGRYDGWELTGAYQGFTTRGDWEFLRPVTKIGSTVVVPDPASLTRINNAAQIHTGLVRVGRDVGEDVHVSLQDYGAFTSRGAPGLDSGGGAFGGQRPDAHQRVTWNLADLSAEAAGLTPLALDATTHLFHRYQRLHFRDPSPLLGAPIDADQTSQTLGGRLEIERALSFAGMDHRATLVFEGSEDRLGADAFGDPSRLSLAGVLQDDVRLLKGQVRLVPGVRYDDTEGFSDRLIPRIGAIVEPWEWLRFQANLERAYRVPSFDELYFPDEGFLRGNPGLRPEEAVAWDAGIALGFRGPWPLDRVGVEAAYFDSEIDDSIVFVLISPYTVAPVNTGAARSRGVEVSASVGFAGWLQLLAAYTYLDARYAGSGTPLPGRTRNEVSGRVVLGPPSGAVKLFGDVLYTDVIPVSASGRTLLPARTTYDAGIAVDLVQIPVVGERLPLRSLLVSFVASNLTDVSVRDAQFFPQPGRVLAVKAEATF